MDSADYVLQPLKGEAWEDFEASIPSAAQAALSILEKGVDLTMQDYNAG